ncbi:hypothetical protein ACS0TY_015661 [Phlomoides rotata]
MPISRYEIRNEYSLADAEVYRVADKDDPEAVLEGVAMAGLVGLLRQLGDLAEFAAEIFHNLHEEVMATAARGHGLISRVQQLETEIPSIERAFLSQTDHSSFFYHAGVDWHPNLRPDQNLVTQGDLPRYLMDSYEDSRAPPRLFLLDKFDVAGAGACLKRYTDPSFFKVKNSEMIGVDVQREKKIRKAKKKGPRWRNGETAKVLQTSHSKLHQLFLEERVENGFRNPSLQVKLKRRLNGFPFDLKAGKSYMEKLLKSPSPDHKVLREVAVKSSLMMSVTNDHKESGSEIFEPGRSPPPSPYREENALNRSMYEPNKPPLDDTKRFEVPNSYPSTAKYGVSSTLDKATGEKVVVVDAQSQREEGLTGYQSDDIASEIDNYVDAPSSIESEIDGDSELRVKSDITSSNIISESLFSDAGEEHFRSRSTDSQSIGGTTKSSDYPSTSVENPREDNYFAKGFDASSYQKTADEDFQVDHQSRPVTDGVNHQSSELEQSTSRLCSNESMPALSLSDSEDVVRQRMLKAPESDEMVLTFNGKEEKANLLLDPPCSPSLCDFLSQSGDDSPGSSAGEHLVDKPNDESLPCVSTEPDIYYHTTDRSLNTSLYSPHEDAFDGKDWNSIDHIASTSSVLYGLSTDVTPETISSKNQILGKLENEVPEVPENSPEYPDTEHNGYSIESAVSKEDNLIDGLYADSNGSPSDFPSIMGGSSNGSTDSNVENNHSNSSTDDQISSENLKLSDLANSPDKPTEGLDVHAGDVIPEETTKKDTCALETLELSEVVGSQGIGLTHHVLPNNSESLESFCCIPENLEEPAKTEDTVEMDGISADLISVDKLHESLDKCETDKSNTIDVPAVSDNASLTKMVEEHDNCFEDSGMDELENDENCPSECHEESDIVEKVGPTEASASGFDDHPKSELSGIFPNSDLVLEVDGGPKIEECGVDREHELFNQSGLENHAPDPEESIAQEKVGLPFSQLDQELVHPGDTSSELSHLLPINHQPMLDHAVFPPNNPFSETNLGDVPSLPPLPPVEWTMGKLQHASSSVEGETVRPKEQSSKLIFPPTVPSDNFTFPLPPTFTDHVDLSPPTASPNVINSSLEEKIHHTQTEVYPETSSKEENVENICSSLEANTLHETTDIPQKSENEQQQFVIPIPEGVSMSAAEEGGAEIYLATETADLPPKVENEQQQIVIPISEDVSTSAAEEIGSQNGNRTVKLQWQRNPLIEDIALLNKSKLRKVTERVLPEIHKVDERDSFLDQIRTKSFNLRPATSSRPNIRGPNSNTNIQVVAILEKANAIRQALAGSDEDDSDSWSDS